jgi:hypothetical protein
LIPAAGVCLLYFASPRLRYLHSSNNPLSPSEPKMAPKGSGSTHGGNPDLGSDVRDPINDTGNTGSGSTITTGSNGNTTVTAPTIPSSSPPVATTTLTVTNSGKVSTLSPGGIAAVAVAGSVFVVVLVVGFVLFVRRPKRNLKGGVSVGRRAGGRAR